MFTFSIKHEIRYFYVLVVLVVYCTCNFVMLIKPIVCLFVFLTFSLPFVSLDLKVPSGANELDRQLIVKENQDCSSLHETMLQNELIIGSNLQSFIEWLGRYFALLLIKNYKVSMTRTSTIKLYGPE